MPNMDWRQPRSTTIEMRSMDSQAAPHWHVPSEAGALMRQFAKVGFWGITTQPEFGEGPQPFGPGIERAMPYTMNGFGTRYYGKRDLAADGSYITTLWITGLYVPIFPLGSYRVKPVGQGTNYVVHRSQSYQVVKVPLCWEQVWHVYMIGAPILLIVGGFGWTEIKKDRAKTSLHSQMDVTGTEVDTAQIAVEKLEGDCLRLLKASRQDNTKDSSSIHAELHDKCAPVVPAIDAYLGKVGRMQTLIGEGLSSKVLDENERSRYGTYQTIWGIRRNQATETRRIAVCLQDFSRECYAGVAPLADAMQKEDKEVCSLLASVNQKCE